MNKRFRIFTLFTILLFSAMIICCNGNTHNKPNNLGKIEPFEIIFKVQPVRPCEGTVYSITEKSITIDFYENKSQGQKDSSGNLKFDCGLTRAYQKDLAKTDDLAEISSIKLEDLKAIPDEGCAGGVGHRVTLNKDGAKKEIHYGGCAEEFDKHTKMIVKFINNQVPGKYQVNL